MTSLAQLRPGTVVGGKYVLGDRIGSGGMGTVFVAEQAAIGRKVAIKVLHPDLAPCPAYAAKLRDEGIAASRVRSAHCVQIIDCGALPDDSPYLVMEYVPGRPLARMVTEEVLSLPLTLELIDQVLSAIAAVHAAGLVHADVKSDNFLVESIAGRAHVTLIDFGLARRGEAPPSAAPAGGEIVISGTPEFMAPEVACGKPAIAASDLYSVGVVLYELLTGAPPFGGDSAGAIMSRHVSEAVVPPSRRCPDRAIPAALDAVVLRALAKQPADRFADAAAFARAVRRAGAPPAAPRPEARRPAAVVTPMAR